MTPVLRHQFEDDGGFTLVELLVAIVLTGIVGAVTLTGVVRSLNVSAEATTRVDALNEVQRAVERISRNIRAADPVVSASATVLAVEVYDDVTRRRITYTHSGAEVTQTVMTFANHVTATPTSSSTTTAIEGLEQGGAPVFTYYTATGDPWNGVVIADIARIEVHLRNTVGGGNPMQLTSSAFVRNTVE